jgi:hypothetical protein
LVGVENITPENSPINDIGNNIGDFANQVLNTNDILMDGVFDFDIIENFYKNTYPWKSVTNTIKTFNDTIDSMEKLAVENNKIMLLSQCIYKILDLPNKELSLQLRKDEGGNLYTPKNKI